MELHLTDEMVALLKSRRINNRLLREIATNDKFEQLMTDTEIYIDGHATSTFRNLYQSLEEQRQFITRKYKQAENDLYSQTLLAAEVKEENFFCHVTHITWDAILHDIRKAHEHDIDRTPDFSLAKKVGLEIRKVILHQKQPSQLPAQEEMKTAVVGMDVPATAAFCSNIIFLSYKTASSFGIRSFHKTLQFPAVNQNITSQEYSPWQVGEVGFQFLSSDSLEAQATL